MKKIIAILLTVSTILGLTIVPNPQVAHAEWGEVTCPGIETCYGCSGFNCDVYSVQTMDQTFTREECAEIANRASAISDWSSYVSIVGGFKFPIPSAFLALYGMSVSKNYKMFEYAAAQGKGLRISCEYVISRTSYSLNRYRKGTYSFVW